MTTIDSDSDSADDDIDDAADDDAGPTDSTATPPAAAAARNCNRRNGGSASRASLGSGAPGEVPDCGRLMEERDQGTACTACGIGFD